MSSFADSPTERSRSLRRLFLLAVLLLFLFYASVLAALTAIALLAHWLFLHLPAQHGLPAAALCAVGGAHLAYWSLPHRYHRSLDGAEITPRTQPVLFDELRAVARAVGEPVPTRVALHDDANACVFDLDAAPGLGPQRGLQIGMPLLRALTVGQLRALVAHELGHFHGEHRYGPWMRRAYLATCITRLRLRSLLDRASLLALPLLLLTAPFRAIASLFQRVALAASRQQERSADEIAIRVAGGAAVIGMLRQLHVAEVVLHLYRKHYVAPALERGLVPPLGEGFSRLLASEDTAEVIARWLQRCAQRGATAGDSHPSFSERTAAAQRKLHAAPLLRDSDRPAISLLDDPEQYETEPTWREVRERGGRKASWSEVEEVTSEWNSSTETPSSGATSPEAERRRTPQLSEGAGGGAAGSLTRARRSC